MTQLLNTINKRDLQDVYAFLKQIEYNLLEVDAITPATLYQDTDGQQVVELEVYYGESYPSYFTLPQTVFEKYADEYFQEELEYLQADADFTSSLKRILSSTNPAITWYEDYADKREQVKCSNYFATQFLNDLTSELLLA
jgi:hypothetical protein